MAAGLFGPAFAAVMGATVAEEVSATRSGDSEASPLEAARGAYWVIERASYSGRLCEGPQVINGSSSVQVHPQGSIQVALNGGDARNREISGPQATREDLGTSAFLIMRMSLQVQLVK